MTDHRDSGLIRAEEAYRIYRDLYERLNAVTEDDLVCVISEWFNEKIRDMAVHGCHSYTVSTGNMLSIEVNIPTDSGILSLTLRDICRAKEISIGELKKAVLDDLREAGYRIEIVPDWVRGMASGACLTVISWGKDNDPEITISGDDGQ